MKVSKQRRRLQIAGIATGAALLGLLVLPLPLFLLGAVDVDWNRLSAIGQSYTAGATLLSGAALLGVVWSLRLQIKQTSILHGQAVRQFQNELLTLAMSNPIYASVIPSSAHHAGNEDQFRRHVFSTQWLRYYEFLFISEEMSAEAMRAELRGFFAISANQFWWSSVQQSWFSKVAILSEQRRQFVELVNEEYLKAAPTPST